MRAARRVRVLGAGAAAAALAVALAAPPAGASLRDRLEDEWIRFPGALSLPVTAESSVAQHVTDSRWVVGSMTTQGVETVFRVRGIFDDAQQLTGARGGRALARAVNENGDVVGAAVGRDGVMHPYAWPVDGPARQLTGAGVAGEATGVNRYRVVAGTVELPEGRRAVVWRDGAQLVLDTVEPARVAPRSPVNDRGQVTGTAGEGEGARAFVWADGVLTWLPTPDGASSESLGISENGRVVGVVSTLGAVVWEPDGAVRRLDPRGLGFVPTDVSERGEVVGTVVASGGDTRPAIVRGGEVVTLPSFGGYVGAAAAVNERGVTAGWTRTARHGADHPVFWHRQVPWRMGEEISGVPARSGRAYDVNEDNWLVGAVQVRNRTGTGFVDVAVLWEMSPEF